MVKSETFSFGNAENVCKDNFSLSIFHLLRLSVFSVLLEINNTLLDLYNMLEVYNSFQMTPEQSIIVPWKM